MSPSRHRQAEVGVDLKKLLVLLPMWIAFVLGSTLGADAQNGDRPGLGPDGEIETKDGWRVMMVMMMMMMNMNLN